MSNYSSNSVFNKTIKDIKKEKITNLYLNVIAPKLIKLIHREIISKYKLVDFSFFLSFIVLLKTEFEE